MMYNCLVYSCTFVFTFVPSVSSKDKIIFICKEKDYHILPNDQNLRLYGHLKIMSTLLFSQALRSDEGQTLELQLFNSSQWAIYAINPVDNTMLPCYTLPLSQHHSFFRNLPPFIHLFFYHNPPFSPPLKKRLFQGGRGEWKCLTQQTSDEVESVCFGQQTTKFDGIISIMGLRLIA